MNLPIGRAGPRVKRRLAAASSRETATGRSRMARLDKCAPLGPVTQTILCRRDAMDLLTVRLIVCKIRQWVYTPVWKRLAVTRIWSFCWTSRPVSRYDIFREKKILKFILRWLILFDIDFTNLSIRNKSVARLIIQPRQRVSMIGLKIFVHTHVTSDID